jgi:hypothetical protein
MPALRDKYLVLERIGEGQLEVEYSAKAGKATLTVDSHPLFHPDDEVVRLCREAAEEYAGAKSGFAVVVSDPWAYKNERGGHVPG